MTNTKVITGDVRLSYVHLLSPYKREGETPKYSVTLLIPKKDTETIANIKAAQKAAAVLGKNSVFGGTIPKSLSTTLHDGDKEKDTASYPEYKDHMYMAVSSKIAPRVFTLDYTPIVDPQEIYSGCYARVSINFSAYNVSGNKGVSGYLNLVVKTADGDPLGGYVSAEADFKEISEKIQKTVTDDDLLEELEL
jgi:hypothetical protein